MAFPHKPGVSGTYLDGSLRIPSITTQPRILVLGTSNTGPSYEPVSVRNVRIAEGDFGANTDLMRGVHEALAQEADNLAVMRIGGRQGSIVIEDDNGETMTIIVEHRGDTILDEYALVIDGSDGLENRILVWDLVREQWVLDTHEVLVLDEGVVQIIDTGLAPVSLGTIGDVSSYLPMSALEPADFTAEAGIDIDSVVVEAGSDGDDVSLVEKYAALNTAYHLLDFKDADFVVPQGVYIDDPNVTDAGSTSNFWFGVPMQGDINDELGYVWQYIYKGKLYTYFTDSSTYFSVSGVAATVTVNTDLVLTADKPGVGGNGISIQIDDSGAAGPTVTISRPDAESLDILVVDDGTSSTADAVVAINTALDNYVLPNGVVASSLVTASGGDTTLLTEVAKTALASGVGGAVLTHEDLTGESVPADVAAKFAAGTDAQLREVNFAHQLASFLHLASTSWKTMLGTISFRGPFGLSRIAVSDWIGSAANYRFAGDGQTRIILAAGNNGSGILGHKLLAGMAASTGGYRNGAIKDAPSSASGLAFGGLIKTRGAGLPNADDYPGFSYGISDTDELLDLNKQPVDIGKHILATYDWPIHRNAFDGGKVYRGPVNMTLAAKLAIMPENEEPIGVNGRVVRVTAPPRVHATQQDQLARIRAIGLKREEGVGFVFVSSKTAAHPDSDYNRVSTIRCVNRHLQGIREIAKPFIGKDFSAQRLVALQSAIDSFLLAERVGGFNQGALASISFSRSDKIMGNLKVKLRMVPPFSIEKIDVETSLAADESEI